MPENSLDNQAVQSALDADWEQAITLNKQILKDAPTNLEALNRLGRAYSETGDIEKAKTTYRSVLKHDPYNSIALKNLERLKAANGSSKITGSRTLNPDLFMEEPGRTKVLELTDLAKPEILANLHTGDTVKIEVRSGIVVFSDASGKKLGSLGGELGQRLARLADGGNVYAAYVKSVNPTELRVFVREVKRAPKFIHLPTFPVVDNGFKPYIHEAVELDEPAVEIEPADTSKAEAEAAKKIASLENMAAEELHDDHSSSDEES